MVSCTKSSEELKLSPVRLARCSSLNLFSENPRTKVLSMHFLKLSTSGNNEPKRGDTPIITMDNTELSLWGTRYSWYVAFVLYPLMKLMFCESSLFLFMLCYFICYVKKTYIFIEKKNSNIFVSLRFRYKLTMVKVKDTF